WTGPISGLRVPVVREPVESAREGKGGLNHRNGVVDLTVAEGNLHSGGQLNILTRHFLVGSLSLAFAWRAELPCAAQAPARIPGLDAYRKYALTHEGDVTRG